MKIALIDHNYPENTPFLLNKYKGLNKLIHVRLFHYGKHKPQGVIPQTSLIHNRLLHFASFVWVYCRRPCKMSSWLYTAYRLYKINGIKQVLIHYPVLLYQPDVIHFEFGTLALNNIILKKLIPTKIIVSFRGYDINYYKLNSSNPYREVWHDSDAFHFLGKDLHQRSISRGYCDDKLNFFIPPAIDLEQFTPDKTHKKQEDGTIRLVSTGRLVWKKGYTYAIQAIKLIVKDGYKVSYTIIGDGPLMTALTFQIHQSGLNEIVNLVGKKTQDEIKRYLQNSDIFLHPAVSEGFCNAVIEAQAMNLPVICTNADGLSENIVHGETGFVVPIYDARAIYFQIKMLLLDRDLLNNFGKAGRERVLNNFVLSNQIEAYKQMYFDVLK
jgi:colanic acid/amylovoran biosynthesis glycosyltransferase